MLICQNAEGVHRRRKVRNPCSREITKLFNKTIQKLSAKLSCISQKGDPEATSKFVDFA